MLQLRNALLAGILCAGAAHAQAPTFPRLPAAAPAGTGVTAACGAPDLEPARCGTFRVFEDRSRGAGRTLDLAFIVLEATDPDARVDDPIVHLPGGPGQTFTDVAPNIARGQAALRRTRDILLVDVRGVGRSAALDCDIAAPGGIHARFGSVFPAAYVRACRDTLAQRADLTLYTTAAAVDDLDELRAWLGYDRVNLMGGSYGTRVAQIWLRRHGGSVRTAILNGVAPIDKPLYVHHARLLQRSLERLVERCADDDGCSRANPDLAGDIATLLARIRERPIPVSIDGTTIPFSHGDLAYALRGLLYGRAGDVPGLVRQAVGGDIRPLAEYYVQRTAWIGEAGGSAGHHFSVLCAEDIDPLTDADVAEATANTFMGAHLIDGYRAVCNVWPHARMPPDHWTPVRSDVPTLLLSGSLDPVTPPEGADDVARHLAHARHIVVPGGGHGVGGPCIARMIARVLETASVADVDASCISDARSPG